jgi:hypothetical protein
MRETAHPRLFIDRLSLLSNKFSYHRAQRSLSLSGTYAVATCLKLLIRIDIHGCTPVSQLATIATFAYDTAT